MGIIGTLSIGYAIVHFIVPVIIAFGAFIGLFFFFGSPVYKALNFVEKTRKSISEALTASKAQMRYMDFDRDTEEAYKRLFPNG